MNLQTNYDLETERDRTAAAVRRQVQPLPV